MRRKLLRARREYSALEKYDTKATILIGAERRISATFADDRFDQSREHRRPHGSRLASPSGLDSGHSDQRSKRDLSIL